MADHCVRLMMSALLAIVLAAGINLAWAGEAATAGDAPHGDVAAHATEQATDGGETFADQQAPTEEQVAGEDQPLSDEEAREAAVEAALEKARFTGEVLVTAQKREQEAQDVPISLFVLSGENIERSGVTDMKDLSDAVAGLEIVNIAPGTNNFSARGVTTLGGGLEATSVVGYYVDEVPVSATGQGPEFAMWDIERVEVLRGPQGTLFGEGSMAGTMRVVTAKPDVLGYSARLSTGLSATADGGGNGFLRAMANIPVVDDKFALRINAGYIDDSGWIDVPDLDEEDANTREQLDLRLAARWIPSDALVIDASYTRQDLDLGTEFTATSPYVLLPTDQIPGAGPVGFLGPTDAVNQSANVTLEYDLGWASLISATSYFDYTADWLIDLTPYVPLFFGPGTTGTGKNPPHATSELWAQELRLTSAGEQRLDWMVGFFYKDSDRIDERNFEFDLHDAFGIPGFDLSDLSSTRDRSQSSSYSLFGKVDWALSERLSMQVGLRYYEDDRDYFFEQLTDSLIFGGVAGTTLQASGSDSDFAPKASLSYRPSDGVMLFAQAGKGFRSGGTNPDSERSDLVPEDYGAEELWAYEIGAKTNPSNTVMANFYLYYNDWTNLQLPFVTPDGLFPFTANAGAARAYGGEVELFAILAKGLSGSLNVAYTDAEISEQVENAVGGIVAREGNTIPFTPEWSGNLGFDYTTPLSARLNGIGRVSWAHRTETYSDPENSSYQINPVYDQVNLSLGVETLRWRLEAFVENLLDDASSIYKYNRVVAVPLTYTTYVRPRTIGARYTINF